MSPGTKHCCYLLHTVTSLVASVAYHSLAESVASVAKTSQANNVAIALASSEGLTPADVVTLVELAEEAEMIAATNSDVMTAKILDTEQGVVLKMGYLGVTVASTNPPKFIHLCYKAPSESVKTKLAIVGNGLNFDSGGYNIKPGPGCSIEMVNCDMEGSSAVLGAVKALGQIKPPRVKVHFIVASCENMISGTALRPRDILTASNGKTIDVNNTDAEGKLNI